MGRRKTGIGCYEHCPKT